MLALSAVSIALNAAPIAQNDVLPSRKKTKRFSPYVCGAATVLCSEGGCIMRAAGTYFEQVPRTVIEKILAQQTLLTENKMATDAAIEKRPVSKALSQTKSRNPKP
jgi:hypothetical protein